MSLVLLASGAVARTTCPEAPETAIRAVKRLLENRDATQELGRQAAHAAVLEARLGAAAAGSVVPVRAA